MSHPLEQHGHLTARAALASVATALFLLGLKAWAAWRTGSVAMLGSLADTGLDLVASPPNPLTASTASATARRKRSPLCSRWA